MGKKKKRDKEKRSRKHTRVIDTVTGPLERRLLVWLAARLPRWATPDMLTGFGFLGTVLITVGYVLGRWQSAWLWVACLGFAVHWYGDSLDGTLARYRHIERPRYGYFIDHSLDALSTTLIFFAIGVSSYVRFEIAVAAMAGYLLLSVYAALSTYVANEFRISYLYLGPTEIRLIAVISTIVVYYDKSPLVSLFGAGFNFFEVVILVLTVLFHGAFIVSCANLASRLSKIEPAQNAQVQPLPGSHHPLKDIEKKS